VTRRNLNAGEISPILSSAGQTLRAFIEQKVVFDAFFYRAFVAMQYFGYLNRNRNQLAMTTGWMC
jgi:hypothetical protein